MYLGERLGLDRDGRATSSELAGRAGTAERWVREWLEHRAASGLLLVDDPAADPLALRCGLPSADVPVRADPGDVRYQACKGVEIAAPQVLAAAGTLTGRWVLWRWRPM